MRLRKNLNAGRARAAVSPWVAAAEQMTEAQAEELRKLADEAAEPDAFDAHIGRDEAALRISALRAKLAHERHRGFTRPFRSS